MALRNGIFHERVARAEIEQIVLVDAGRHDHKRRLLDLCGLRRVLNELDQLVLEHDRAGRGSEIAADLEGGFIHPRDAALLQILDQVLHAVGETLGAGLDRAADDFRIGRGEVRRAHRVDELPRIESKLEFRLVVDLRLIDEVGQLLGAQQIGLLEQLVEWRMGPGVILEAPVAAGCFRRCAALSGAVCPLKKPRQKSIAGHQNCR